MVMLSEEAVRASVPHTKARGTDLPSAKWSSKIPTFPKVLLTNATAKNTHPSSDLFLTALLLALVLALALDHAPDSS